LKHLEQQKSIIMKEKPLHRKRVAFAVLFTLLLSVAGVTNATAQSFTVGDLTYSFNDDGASVTLTGHVDGISGQLVIPESVELYGTSYPVTAIGEYAFQYCYDLTGDLVIPNSVITIGRGAFYSCPSFTGSLIIGDAVQSIGFDAFSECYGFTGSLNVGNSVQTIGGYAFHNCSGFTGSLTIGNSVQTIDQNAFSGCTGFTGSLAIGNAVQTIGYDAFLDCSGFTGSLVIGNSVQTIGEYAFGNCSGFTGSLTISESVTQINYLAFYNCNGFTSLDYNAVNCNLYGSGWGGYHWLEYCSSLTTLTIGENVHVIPDNFLKDHSSLLGDLVIPNTVTTIGENAFYGCSGFTGSLNIPNSVTTISNSAFYGCSGFTSSLTIGNAVTTIGENAFNGCSGFTGSLTIPNSVTTIGSSAFLNCSGFSGTLTLGNSLTQIDNSAFFGACENITSFEVWAETPPALGNYVFLSANTGIPVYVPCSTLEAYQNASGWSNFTNFQEFNPCQWMITAEVTPTSGGTVSGDGLYYQGQTCTLVANPNDDFFFVNWTEDGVEVSTDAAYTFTVSASRHLVANFQIDNLIGEGTETSSVLPSYSYFPYSLTQQIYTAEEIGQMGVIRSVAFFNAGSQKNRDFDIYLVHTEKSSFNSSNDWVAVTNSDKVFSGNVTMLSNDWTIITFDTPFAYNGTSNIVMVVNDNTGGWNSGLACRVFNTQSQAIYIYDNGTNFNPTNPFGYSGSVTDWKNQIALGFSSLDAAVFATVSPEGAGSVSGEGAYQLGETCTLAATPSSDDYVFVNWTEDGEVVSTNAQYSFTVTGNRNLVANFLQFRVNIIVSANPEEGGTVTGAGSYLLGQTCTLTASPNENYVFMNWMENGEEISTDLSCSFTVTGNRTMVARFLNPVGTVQAEYYPDNMNPGSPYVQLIWNNDPFEALIGDEASATNTPYMPFYTLYNYSISEALYTAAELAEAGVSIGSMTSLSWEAVEVTTNQTQNNISIWMANVPDSELTTTSHLASNMTLVYSGSIGVPPLGWNEFVFNEGSFAWDGHSNVLILVQRNNGQWNGSVKWRSHNPGFYGMAYKYQDDTPYNATAQTYNVTCTNTNRPNTLFKGLPPENDNYYYKVYRKECDTNDYSLVADSVSGSTYLDSLWLQLPLGSYQYGISARRNDGSETGIVASNCIERGYYTYQITATANLEGCGTVTGAGEYELGSTCTLVATTLNGCSFLNWTEDGQVISTEAEYSFMVLGNRTLVANFVRPIYTITATANPEEGGTISISGLTTDFDDGTLQGWTAIDADGDGRNWYVRSNDDSGDSYNLYGHSGSYFVASFSYYNGSINPDNYLISPKKSNASSIHYFVAGNYSYRDHYGVYASTTGNSIYDFSLVYEETIPSAKVNMTSWYERTVELPEGTKYVAFRHFNSYDMYFLLLDDITIIDENTPNRGEVNFEQGSTCVLNAIPNYGYAFENWTENGDVISTNSELSFIVNSDRDLVANFVLAPFTINATPNFDDRGTVSGSGGYLINQACTVTATPYQGHNFVCWTEDGQEVSTEASYTFTVEGPRNLVAVFTAYVDDIIVFADPNTKAVCVNNWDADGDGELTCDEAAAVWDLGYAFYYNQSITSFDELQYFTGLDAIGYDAFYECTSLTSIVIPEGVTLIDSYAFYDCYNLVSVNIPDGVVWIGDYAFYVSGLLGELTLPEPLEYVGEYAFFGCDGITTVNYNAVNCQTVGSAAKPAFYDCAFTHLNIGANVQNISNFAFKRCFMITDMTVAAVNPPTIYAGTFGMVSRSIPVSVPHGSGDAYRSAQYWEEFFNIIEVYFNDVQIISLSQGTNWFSTYLDITLEDLQAALVEALPSATSITIKSQRNGQSSYNGTRWRGALGTLDVALMYQITVPESCEIELEGIPVDPAEHPVTIKSGPNWIGFPFGVSMTPTDAFAGFAVSGDVIRSRTQQANYTNRWRGALGTLEPGQGYIYNSAATSDRILTFPVSAK
jgi:hypothetical protein